MTTDEAYVFYGLEDQEELDFDPSEVIERVLEDACEKAGEGFDAIADRIEWPIRVLEYKHLTPSESNIVSIALDSVLDHLFEEYGNPDGGGDDPTDDMRTAARRLAKVAIRDFQVWRCEPTGEVTEYTREEVKKEEVE